MSLLLLLLFAANLFWGSVSVPFGSVVDILSGNGGATDPTWNFIVTRSRIPQGVTAMLAGAYAGDEIKIVMKYILKTLANR